MTSDEHPRRSARSGLVFGVSALLLRAATKPRVHPALRKTLRKTADEICGAFARVLGFVALFGALAFVMWGNLHRLF